MVNLALLIELAKSNAQVIVNTMGVVGFMAGMACLLGWHP